MADIRLTLLVGLLGIAFVSDGWDRLKEFASSKAEPQAKAKVFTKEVTMESLLDQVIAKDQEDIAKEHKAGKTEVVGLVDGKRWLGSP